MPQLARPGYLGVSRKRVKSRSKAVLGDIGSLREKQKLIPIRLVLTLTGSYCWVLAAVFAASDLSLSRSWIRQNSDLVVLPLNSGEFSYAVVSPQLAFAKSFSRGA